MFNLDFIFLCLALAFFVVLTVYTFKTAIGINAAAKINASTNILLKICCFLYTFAFIIGSAISAFASFILFFKVIEIIK